MNKIARLILAAALLLGGVSTAGPAFASGNPGNGNNGNSSENGNAGGGNPSNGNNGNSGTNGNAGGNSTGNGNGQPSTPATPTPSASPSSPTVPAPSPSVTEPPVVEVTPSQVPTETPSAETTESPSETPVPSATPSAPSNPTWEPSDCVLPEGVVYEQIRNSGMGKTSYRATAPAGSVFLTETGTSSVLDFEGATPANGGYCPVLRVIPSAPATDAPWNSGVPTASPPPIGKGTPLPTVAPTTPPMVPCDVIGRVNIPSTDPMYDPRNDHDKDGYACDKDQPTKGSPVSAPVAQEPRQKPSLAPIVVTKPNFLEVTSSDIKPIVEPQLASTGADKTGWALVGGILVLLGLLLVAVPKMARRKH